MSVKKKAVTISRGASFAIVGGVYFIATAVGIAVYLGEILMWWGIGVSAVSALGMNYWYLLAGALANTLLFLFVSIPMADKRQSRKAGFPDYKNETNMLLPIPKGKR